jgi:hypothetical protein
MIGHLMNQGLALTYGHWKNRISIVEINVETMMDFKNGSFEANNEEIKGMIVVSLIC